MNLENLEVANKIAQTIEAKKTRKNELIKLMTDYRKHVNLTDYNNGRVRLADVLNDDEMNIIYNLMLGALERQITELEKSFSEI